MGRGILHLVLPNSMSLLTELHSYDTVMGIGVREH
jgi:hypothetical protein